MRKPGVKFYNKLSQSDEIMVKKRRRVKDIKTYLSLHLVNFNLIIESYCSAFYKTRDLKRLKEKRKDRKK